MMQIKKFGLFIWCEQKNLEYSDDVGWKIWNIYMIQTEKFGIFTAVDQ